MFVSLFGGLVGGWVGFADWALFRCSFRVSVHLLGELPTAPERDKPLTASQLLFSREGEIDRPYGHRSVPVLAYGTMGE